MNDKILIIISILMLISLLFNFAKFKNNYTLKNKAAIYFCIGIVFLLYFLCMIIINTIYQKEILYYNFFGLFPFGFTFLFLGWKKVAKDKDEFIYEISRKILPILYFIDVITLLLCILILL